MNKMLAIKIFKKMFLGIFIMTCQFMLIIELTPRPPLFGREGELKGES
jgi:hypothetical protein